MDVQRHLAHPIACEKKASPPSVPQRERKHSPKVMHERDAGVFVEMDDDLRVAAATKNMSALLECVALLDVIVALAICDDRNAAILAEEGLIAVLGVDDREAAHAEEDMVVFEETAGIGAAV